MPKKPRYCSCGKEIHGIAKAKDNEGNPCCPWCAYKVIKSRKALQSRKTPKTIRYKGRIESKRRAFYKKAWDSAKDKYGNVYCEESGDLLGSDFPGHGSNVSHILSGGAYPELYYELDNINILTYKNHVRWENKDKENMKIYSSNLEKIEALKIKAQRLRKGYGFQFQDYSNEEVQEE